MIAIFFIPLFYYLAERMFGEKDSTKKTVQPSESTPSAQIPDGAVQSPHEGD